MSYFCDYQHIYLRFKQIHYWYRWNCQAFIANLTKLGSIKGVMVEEMHICAKPITVETQLRSFTAICFCEAR